MCQLWWEMGNRECDVRVNDVMSDGTNIEKVQCAGPCYRHENPRQFMFLITVKLRHCA